jgi:hypothetical protein
MEVKMVKYSTLFVVMLTLAACGERQEELVINKKATGVEKKLTVTDEEGVSTIKSGASTTRMGSLANLTLPTGIDVYPKAEINSTITSKEDKTASSAISIITKDSPEQVVGFYKDSFTKKGFVVTSEANAASQIMVSLVRKTDSMMAFIMTTQGKNGTSAVITTSGK